jgi:hypothetical protein
LQTWGAKVKLKGAAAYEYVFYTSDKGAAQNVDDGLAAFEGVWGYARENQLAVFKGTKVAYDGFAIEKSGGDFGVSAEYKDGKITGRYAGTAGGSVAIALPQGFTPAKVTVDGAEVPNAIQGTAAEFEISVAQTDGVKSYVIE